MPEKFEQPPTYEERFGNIAIRMKFITAQQLIEALNNQVIEEIRDGKRRLIGQILFELGYMTVEQIEAVLAVLVETG